MALKDLGNVTRALMELLGAGVPPIIGAPSINTSAAAPGSVTTPENVLSVYLFHMMEDPYYKNAPGALGVGASPTLLPNGAAPVPPVAAAPLALNLFYVVTAHHSTRLVEM